jgi:molecular chaperone DnaJ
VEKRDYYDLLGISHNATEIEIKKAYRALAIQYHPDKNQGNPQSESHFKEIAEAYNVLLSPRNRALYEQFGHSLTPTDIPRNQEDKFDLLGTIFDITSDFLDGLFGSKGEFNKRFCRGYDHKLTIKLSPQDAAHGKDVPVSYKRLQTCDTCSGTGALPGTLPMSCPRCQGRGEERKIGSILAKTTCIGCGGKGRVIPVPCLECSGEGRVVKVRKLTISISPKTKNGDVLKIQSEGEAGANGGPYGDLYVAINVR